MMIQFSTTLHGTFEYKPLLLNWVWGFRNGKRPAYISDVICAGEARQKAESWQWKIPGSFLLPAILLQPLWLTPKLWQDLNAAFHWVTYLALEEHTLVKLASGQHFHSLCTTLLMPSKLKQNPKNLLPCSPHYIGFVRVWRCLAGWICPWNFKYRNVIDGELFHFLQ